MSRLSEWYRDTYDEAWFDPATRRGLVGGLLQTALDGVLLVVTFVLAALLGIVRPEAVAANPTGSSLLAGLLALCLGLATVYAYTRRDDVPPRARSPAWRAFSQVLFVAVFMALLAIGPDIGLLAGLGWLLGRAGAHVASYAFAAD